MAEGPSLSKERRKGEELVVHLLIDSVCRLKSLRGVEATSANRIIALRDNCTQDFDRLVCATPAVGPSQWARWMREGRVVPDLLFPHWRNSMRVTVGPEQGLAELSFLRYGTHAPTRNQIPFLRYGTHAPTGNETFLRYGTAAPTRNAARPKQGQADSSIKEDNLLLGYKTQVEENRGLSGDGSPDCTIPGELTQQTLPPLTSVVSRRENSPSLSEMRPEVSLVKNKIGTLQTKLSALAQLCSKAELSKSLTTLQIYQSQGRDVRPKSFDATQTTLGRIPTLTCQESNQIDDREKTQFSALSPRLRETPVVRHGYQGSRVNAP